MAELAKLDFEVSHASSLGECRRVLLRRPEDFDLLIVDDTLPDGSWSQVLDLTLDSEMDCELIVSSHTDDAALWAEVLNRGGYDILVEPYDRQEVDRIVQGAIESHYLKRFASSKNVIPAA
jgi:DNA-binding NtrC family response regulator